jgi:hypothetical protein
MGASFGYASAPSLDMPGYHCRGLSREQCVLPCAVWEREARVPHPISVESRRRGISVRPWMGASFRYASVPSLDMPWLPLPRFESRAVRVAVCGLGARSEGATPNIR